MTPAHAPAEPFFLASAPGERFCLFHPAQGECTGALVYVHPFAEEMNKSRRMAALQARALAAQGCAVLQIDLHGCGDSDGDFGQARWEQWKADIGAACSWLARRSGQPVGLWGLRLGALLALDYAHGAPQAPARLVLWQPVTSGAAFLTQFLRLRLASDMLGEAEGNGGNGGTVALRAALAAGEALEIGGYLLSPQLAAAIEGLDAAALAPPCATDWFDIVAAPDRPVSPVAQRLAAAWQANPPALRKVACPPFWSTQEITESEALVAATCAALREHIHAA